jgi:hypothetical protein
MLSVGIREAHAAMLVAQIQNVAAPFAVRQLESQMMIRAGIPMMMNTAVILSANFARIKFR